MWIVEYGREMRSKVKNGKGSSQYAGQGIPHRLQNGWRRARRNQSTTRALNTDEIWWQIMEFEDLGIAGMSD